MQKWLRLPNTTGYATWDIATNTAIDYDYTKWLTATTTYTEADLKSNKKLGTEFEREVCKKLKEAGYWVHFISPDNRGAQPFDIIAVRNGKPLAIDCKTCVSKTFNISRLEENQKFAFEKWINCGNGEPLIAVKHGDRIIIIQYSQIKDEQSVNLEGEQLCLEDLF